MRKLFTQFLFLCVIAANAQVKPVASASNPPAFYVDSIKVNMNYSCLNPQNIERVDVVKEYDPASPTTYGKIFIKLKANKKMLSLKQITGTHVVGQSQMLYIIDKKIITDTSGVRIDTSMLQSVHYVSTSDIQYMKQGPKITVCMIETKSEKSNNEKGLKIMIRGNNELIKPDQQQL